MPIQANRKIVYAMDSSAGRTKMYLYDEITKEGDFNWEEWKEEESETSAKHFAETLDDTPAGQPIDLYINSAGGDVYEANAIYANLVRHGNITAYIDGIAYSAAALVAMAADRIVMANGSTMLVHNAWTICCGNAEQLRQEADNLDALMASNRGVFMTRFTGTEQELISLMEKEQVLSTDDCMKYGFADEVCDSCGGGDDKKHQDAAGAAIEERITQLINAAKELKTRAEAARPTQQKKPENTPEQKPINLTSVLLDGLKRVGEA